MKQHTMQNRQMYSLNICNIFFESRDYLLNARMRAMPNGHAALQALTQISSYRDYLFNIFIASPAKYSA